MTIGNVEFTIEELKNLALQQLTIKSRECIHTFLGNRCNCIDDCCCAMLDLFLVKQVKPGELSVACLGNDYYYRLKDPGELEKALGQEKQEALISDYVSIQYYCMKTNDNTVGYMSDKNDLEARAGKGADLPSQAQKSISGFNCIIRVANYTRFEEQGKNYVRNLTFVLWFTKRDSVLWMAKELADGAKLSPQEGRSIAQLLSSYLEALCWIRDNHECTRSANDAFLTLRRKATDAQAQLGSQSKKAENEQSTSDQERARKAEVLLNLIWNAIWYTIPAPTYRAYDCYGQAEMIDTIMGNMIDMCRSGNTMRLIREGAKRLNHITGRNLVECVNLVEICKEMCKSDDEDAQRGI